MEEKLIKSKPSLLQLNEYCLLHIFEFLELDDSINLGDCCKYLRMVADRAFKKYSEFHLYWRKLKKGERYINFLLSHIGRHVLSLRITLFCLHLDLRKYLTTIDTNSKNLKCLKICEYRSDGRDVPYSAYNFENVESVMLFRFNSSSTRGFLASFHHLKLLYLVECSVNATEGLMEEMRLENIDIDEYFFDVLTSFDKIKLLAIEYATCGENKKIKTSTVWPTTLKHLRLAYFELTFNDFIEIIRQLNNLERMDLCASDFAEADLSYFEDLTKSSKQTVPRILKAVKTSTGKQCREIVLPTLSLENEDKKCLIETSRIKVIYKFMLDDCDHLKIGIDFPEIEDL